MVQPACPDSDIPMGLAAWRLGGGVSQRVAVGAENPIPPVIRGQKS